MQTVVPAPAPAQAADPGRSVPVKGGSICRQHPDIVAIKGFLE